MEFFEFDNSFVAGYGEEHTSLTSGDEHVAILTKQGDRLGTTCNNVESFKAKGEGMRNMKGGITKCVDDLPYSGATKGGETSKLSPVTSTRKFR